MVTEESAEIDVPSGKISKQLGVFYNPVMKLNRDVSVLLLDSVPDKDMQIALPLAGSGVRGIRFFKELKKGKIKSIAFNDYKTSESIKKNLEMNRVKGEVFGKDANMFLLESRGFDYIDIDPFGSPNPFLDSAIVRLARNGILAVTATDTAALAGSSPLACRRKYWAKPLRNGFMHETAIRILIRKVQLVGAEHEKSLRPIFSYSKDHYYRVFLRAEKGRKKADELLKEHAYLLWNRKTQERKVSEHNCLKGFDYAGPMWVGGLWDKKLVKAMLKNSDKDNKKLFGLVSLISEESEIDAVGFYDLHRLSQAKKKPIPKVEDVVRKGVSRTHFLGWGVRTRNSINKIM